MREVTYTDGLGQMFLTRIPDSAPDAHAAFGVRVGPPELDTLGLPIEIQVRLHNELYARRVWTWAELRARRADVADALRTALKLGVGDIERVYWDAR